MSDSWKRFIPTYIIGLDSNYDNVIKKTGKKAHLLFVESVSDKKLYNESIFPNIKDSSGKYNYTLDSEDDFIVPFDKSYDLIMSENGIVSPGRGSAVEFVKKCLSFCSDNADVHNIDCFGFIDKDFSHNIESISQLVETFEHDIETNIIRCYMPDYIEKISDKNKAITIFSNVLYFAFAQGVLEKASIIYSKKAECKDYKEIDRVAELTHDEFKNNTYYKDYIGGFNFDDYINCKRLSVNSLFMMFYKNICEETNITNKVTIINIIKKWLFNIKLNETEIKTIDKAFEYANGHMLLEQLLFQNKMIFNLKETKPFHPQNMIDNFKVFLSNDYTKICSIDPLKTYIDFREKKRYFYSLKL